MITTWWRNRGEENEAPLEPCEHGLIPCFKCQSQRSGW